MCNVGEQKWSVPVSLFFGKVRGELNVPSCGAGGVGYRSIGRAASPLTATIYDSGKGEFLDAVCLGISCNIESDLALAEFAANNAINVAISYTFFFLNLGDHPIFPSILLLRAMCRSM